MMNKVVLSIGSNCSEREKQMTACVEWLTKKLLNMNVSHTYETPALNGIDNSYLNAVIMGYVSVDYDELRLLLKQYEKNCGRNIDSKRNGIIPIDIDIVVWNDEILKKQDFNQSYFQIGWTSIYTK